MKGIYEKKGWFYFQPPTPKDHSARPKPVNLKTKALEEAIVRAKDWRTGAEVEHSLRAGTLAEVLPKYYSDRRGDSVLTRRSRKTILDAFMRDTGNPRVKDISEGMIERWRDGLATRRARRGGSGTVDGRNGKDGKDGSHQEDGGAGKCLSGTTIRTYTITVKAFCQWAVEEGLMRRNPAARLKKATRVAVTRRHEFLTEEERERLLACEMPDHARLVLMLGFFAGLRDGEMLAMTPAWLWLAPDGSRGTITVQETPCTLTNGRDWVWRPKTREMRTIPMHPRLLAYVREYGLREPWMIAPEKVRWPDETRNSKRFDSKKALHAVAAKAGVPRLNFHMLRHSFATHLAMKGVPLAEIAGLLGDSLAVTEAHYAGFCPNRVNPLEVL